MINPRYLYCIELETYSWACEPLPITNLGFIQLSLTNPIGAILKMKTSSQATLPFIILENENLEEMIRYFKRVFFCKVFFEYKDSLTYKNLNGKERTFNLVQMIIFREKDLETRFKNTELHGFMFKMSLGWRQKLGVATSALLC